MKYLLFTAVLISACSHGKKSEFKECPSIDEEPISLCRARADCGLSGGRKWLRVGAAFLSGTGSGMSGQPNYAIQNQEACLDRSLAAQKANAEMDAKRLPPLDQFLSPPVDQLSIPSSPQE